MRGRYVVELWRRKQEGRPVSEWRLKPRHEMSPQESARAYWTFEELHALLEQLYDKWKPNRRFAEQCFLEVFHALSYRWLDESHPDPEGFHLDIVGAVSELRLMEDGVDSTGEPNTLSGIVFAGTKIQHDFALFWDYCSLVRDPRTPEDQALLDQGMRYSSFWYGHANTTV